MIMRLMFNSSSSSVSAVVVGILCLSFFSESIHNPITSGQRLLLLSLLHEPLQLVVVTNSDIVLFSIILQDCLISQQRNKRSKINKYNK